MSVVCGQGWPQTYNVQSPACVLRLRAKGTAHYTVQCTKKEEALPLLFAFSVLSRYYACLVIVSVNVIVSVTSQEYGLHVTVYVVPALSVMVPSMSDTVSTAIPASKVI